MMYIYIPVYLYKQYTVLVICNQKVPIGRQIALFDAGKILIFTKFVNGCTFIWLKKLV